MPLASSREASLKRQQALEAEKKERKRMRMSLPHTINSTTSVNEEKVNRRRSLRRQSSLLQKLAAEAAAATAQDVNDENHSPNVKQGPTPYGLIAKERGGKTTPPETRSAKKKKENHLRLLLPPSDLPKPGVMIMSPPNQARNEKRFKEQANAQLKARNHRVQENRKKGRMLVFSPSNRAGANGLPEGFHDDDDNNNNDNKHDDSQTEQDDLPTDRIEPGESKIEHHEHEQDDSQIENQDHDDSHTQHFRSVEFDSESDLTSVGQTVVNRDAEMSQDLRSIRKSLAGFPQLEQLTSQLAEARARQTSLEHSLETVTEEKKQLQQELRDQQKDHQTDIETRLAETIRLEERIKADRREFELKIQQLESIQSGKDKQFLDAKNEAKAYAEEIRVFRENQINLKSELEQAKIDLAKVTKEYEKTQLDMEAESSQMKSMNKNLEEKAHELESANQAFQEKIDEYLQVIHRYENEISPDFANAQKVMREQESQIEELRATIAELQAKLESVESERDQAVSQLEEESKAFQNLKEESGKKLDAIIAEGVEKDAQIEEFVKQLTDARMSIEERNLVSEQIRADYAKEVNEMKLKAQTLEDALDDVMNQLEASEKKCSHHEMTIQDLRAQLQAKAGHHEAIQQESDSVSEALALARDRENLLRSQNEQMVSKLADMQRTLAIRDAEVKDLRNHVDDQGSREAELYDRLQTSDEIRRELHARVMQLMGNIRVFVRVRPLLGKKSAKTSDELLIRFPGHHQKSKENQAGKANGSVDDLTKKLIQITEPKKDRGGLSDRRKHWEFGFDEVFTPDSSQNDVWKATEPLVQSAIDGFNVTIFAYGQTGSGKTYTLLGDGVNCRGIVGESIEKLFRSKHEMESVSEGKSKMSFTVEMLEIYNEEVRDLMASDKGTPLPLKVNSQEVVGNQIIPVSKAEDVLSVLVAAQARRCVKATASNSESSRSHLLFTLNITVELDNGVQRIGKLNICDLAGSERLDKSGTHVVGGALFKESLSINKSLSTLSTVIEKLQAGSSCVPYRESKLTFLLKNSLSGNSKTLAIVCCNPDPSHHHETLCSLRFAEKVNKVELKNSAAKFTFD